MSEGAAWGTGIDEYLTVVDGWGRRISDLDAVEAGSLIANDDLGRPTTPVRISARAGIVAAVDHLALGADLIQSQAPLRPFAFFTAMRASIVGASQAIWVLSGSPAQRIDRALSVEADELRMQRKYLKFIADDPHAKQHLGPDKLSELQKGLAQANSRIKELGKARVGSEYDMKSFDTTRMIKEAAMQYAKTRPDSSRQIRAITEAWQLACAGSHARMWPYALNGSGKELPDGRMVVTAKSGVLMHKNFFGLSAELTNFAWYLWDTGRKPELLHSPLGTPPALLAK